MDDRSEEDYFTRAFPTLFPWGTAKHIDHCRETDLPFRLWVQLLLRHSSRYIIFLYLILINSLFQSNSCFIIVTFDLMRRRRVLTSANLLTSRVSWQRTKEIIESLTERELTHATTEVQQHKPISHPAVRELLKLLRHVGSSSLGSDERKTQMLSNMKSMIIRYDCPLFFITVNPADRHSPISLFYAGLHLIQQISSLRIMT